MRFAKNAFPVVVVAVALALMSATVTPASAFTNRVPQVGFANGSLQGYLNGVPQTINTLIDQLDAQEWNTSSSGNATFTLMIELAGNAPFNSIGVYNGNDPNPIPLPANLYQLFPGAASAGWFVTCHFGTGNSLVVTLFDNNSIIQGQTVYGGVNANDFGFYLQGPGGLFFSQDGRNPGSVPQVLTYAGTGRDFGDWWECFEDLPYNPGADFDDAVLLLQSVGPTPVTGHSWGALKRLYH